MRRIAIVTAVVLMATATWYAAFRAVALAHYVDSELSRAKSLTELGPAVRRPPSSTTGTASPPSRSSSSSGSTCRSIASRRT